ncbi:hypothetical protein ACJ5NV_08630 [Loktanella agnita]|uniref:hypothetical protein n=1 Tax=Loktanella agnita TaxID=287097 RepID=UPI003988937C
MTDFNAPEGSLQMHLAKSSCFTVDDTYWGYIVRSGRGPAIGIMLAQAASFFLGACFLTAALGILILPMMGLADNLGAIGIGAAVMFMTVAAYLLWFASRGTQSEVHVDTSVGEIREMICNRTGKPTLVGAYGFDTVSGIHIEEQAEGQQAQLVMQHRNGAHHLIIAEGSAAQLISLRDRLGQDLMIAPKGAARQVA